MAWWSHKQSRLSFKTAHLLSTRMRPNNNFLCKVEACSGHVPLGCLAGRLVPLSDAPLSLFFTCCSSCFPKASPLLSALLLSQQNCKQLSFQLSLQINPAVVRQWKPRPPTTPLPPISFQKGGRPSKRSGKWPDCWVKAREKEPVVRSLTSFPAAGGRGGQTE